MNDDVKDRMTKYLDAMEKAAGKVGDFAEVEVPATIREWLLWMTIEHCVIAAMFLIAAAVAFRLGGRMLAHGKKMKEESKYSEWEPYVGFGATMRYVATAGLLVGFVFQGLWAAKCVFAPRVVVVEHVATLVRGK